MRKLNPQQHRDFLKNTVLFILTACSVEKVRQTTALILWLQGITAQGPKEREKNNLYCYLFLRFLQITGVFCSDDTFYNALSLTVFRHHLIYSKIDHIPHEKGVNLFTFFANRLIAWTKKRPKREFPRAHICYQFTSLFLGKSLMKQISVASCFKSVNIQAQENWSTNHLSCLFNYYFQFKSAVPQINYLQTPVSVELSLVAHRVWYLSAQSCSTNAGFAGPSHRYSTLMQKSSQRNPRGHKCIWGRVLWELVSPT